MSAQPPLPPQILPFGSLKCLIFFPLPFDMCRFYKMKGNPTSDALEATIVELFLIGGQKSVMLERDDAKAFVDWYLTISGERKVEPIGLHRV